MKTEDEIVERLKMMDEYMDIRYTGAEMKPELEELFDDIHSMDDVIAILEWVLDEEE